MKVRALQSCQVDNTYRRGPEYSDKDELLAEGEVFSVDDDYPINPEVLEVIEPPANGKKPNILKLTHAGAAQDDDDIGDDGSGKPKGRGKQGK